jgi:hypothetical protein
MLPRLSLSLWFDLLRLQSRLQLLLLSGTKRLLFRLTSYCTYFTGYFREILLPAVSGIIGPQSTLHFARIIHKTKFEENNANNKPV